MVTGAQPHAKRICVRGDTDFFLTRHLDRWAKSVDFIFGMDANAAMRSRAEKAQWQPLQRKPRYHTVTDQKRKRNQPHEKQRIVQRYFFYITVGIRGIDNGFEH